MRLASAGRLWYDVRMITIEKPHGEVFPVVRAETASGRTEVCLYGAHILNWVPRGGKPVFYMSGATEYRAGKGLRGGVPICWPWFGKHPTDAAKYPKHGTARVSRWELLEQEESAGGTVRLSFALRLPNMPEALYSVQMGEDSLCATLRTQAVQAPMPYSAALHSYFAVSDYEQVQVEGLEDASFEEFADEVVPHSETPLIPTGPINRIYHPVPEDRVITLKDRAWGREVRIEREGSRSCVVWNPGEKEAAGISDIEPGTFRHFLAVETAVVPAEGIRLCAGDTHEVTMRLSVRSILP